MKSVMFTGTGANEKQFMLLRTHVLEFITLTPYAITSDYHNILVTRYSFCIKSEDAWNLIFLQ